ncbi:hypothetical protein D9599_25735 [Roseomonas sp. KE2513]|uniref:DUF5681 domain-containing protein n=1 Tax=Roseomonas sp. KE2513 TaxID=2479202 RepID=UPI0018E00A67|nr:DUF5681 domain-containing protein [Roseomonas sp. KE2513]MBI0538959.1 hypothetical protein [Roseomonas sp. KE2513]
MVETTGSKQKRQGFQPGQSGNPAGRPKGSRHAALLALDAIGQEAAADVLRKVVEDAKGGDLRASEILLRRLWPERKGRPIALDLPPLEKAADVVAGLAVVAAAMASGDLTPDEASAVAGVLEGQRRAIETNDLEARLAALEAAAVKS